MVVLTALVAPPGYRRCDVLIGIRSIAGENQVCAVRVFQGRLAFDAFALIFSGNNQTTLRQGLWHGLWHDVQVGRRRCPQQWSGYPNLQY